MAISNGQVSIGTVATPIDGVWTNPSIITIHNNDNTDAVYLGGEGVTTANGLALLKQESYQFQLQPLEQIYCVSVKLGHTISWMRQTI
jgi:hypothetical protein